MDNVIIKFTGPWRGYSKGEIAGFPEDVAESLIKGGRAEAHDEKKGGKPPAKPKSNGPGKGAGQSGPSTEPAPNSDQATTDPEDDDKP